MHFLLWDHSDFYISSTGMRFLLLVMVTLSWMEPKAFSSIVDWCTVIGRHAALQIQTREPIKNIRMASLY